MEEVRCPRPSPDEKKGDKEREGVFYTLMGGCRSPGEKLRNGRKGECGRRSHEELEGMDSWHPLGPWCCSVSPDDKLYPKGFCESM